MAQPPDPIAALIAYLKADPDTFALVTDRVFGAELPEAESALMPRKCLVIQSAGGFGNRNYRKEYNLRIDLRCYGESASEAMKVHLAAHQALQALGKSAHAAFENCLIYSASKDTGPFFNRENTVFWPYIYSVWSVMTNLTSLA